MLKQLALEYFVAGIQSCNRGEVERGGAILEIALQLAEASDHVETNEELDFLNNSIISFTWNSRNLEESAAFDYVEETLPALMDRIETYLETADK
jgi:hypothetical protein